MTEESEQLLLDKNRKYVLEVINNIYKIAEYNTVLVIILNELLLHLTYGVSSEPFHSEYEAALHPDETGLNSDELKRVTSLLIKCDYYTVRHFEIQYIAMIRHEVSLWTSSVHFRFVKQDVELDGMHGSRVVQPAVCLADHCLEESLHLINMYLTKLRNAICQKQTTQGETNDEHSYNET